MAGGGVPFASGSTLQGFESLLVVEVLATLISTESLPWTIDPEGCPTLGALALGSLINPSHIGRLGSMKLECRHRNAL